MDGIINPAKTLFGERIKSALKEKGWSQNILAGKINLARVTISKAVNGKKVSNESIEKIADALAIEMPPGLRADPSESRFEAYGDYDQKKTATLCGRFEVFRPSARAGKEINCTNLILYWSDIADCLVFYERTFSGCHWGRVFHNSAYVGWDFLSNAFGIPRLCRLELKCSKKQRVRFEGFSEIYEDTSNSGKSPTIACQIEDGEFFGKEHAEDPCEIGPSDARYFSLREALNELAEYHILRTVPEEH